jgi:hypothetical protein
VEQPPPPVTIRDPRRPADRYVVEDADEDQASLRGGAGADRRWVRAGIAAVVAAAALLVVADVRAERLDAERERRLDGVVQVELAEPGSYTGAFGPLSGRGTVELALRLRNTGTRDVTITQAEQGELRFAGEAVLPAGSGTTLLRLTRSVGCPPAGRLPEPEREGRPLVMQVVTPAGPREAVLEDALPIGSLNEGLRSACGYPALERAVTLGGTVLGPRDRTVEMRVELTNTSRWRARLVSLFHGRGLTVITIDGRTDALPMPLPPASERGPTGRAVDVVLGLDCSALIVSASLRPLEEINVLVDDGTGLHIGQLSAELSDPEALLRKHAYKTCVTG